MRLQLVAVLCLLFAGCAWAKPPDLRGTTPEEQTKLDELLTPLVQASGICRPKEPCAVGLAVDSRERIHVAAGPDPRRKFALRITTGAFHSLQPSELRAALAHELGHVQLGHFESREARWQAERLSKTAVNGARDEVLRTNRASDREEEFAADSYAVALLDRLPGSPGHGCTDMLLLLERLDLEQLTPGWANWLSTHPTPAARLQVLQMECNKKP